MNKVTVQVSVVVRSSPDKVWDYTQDWRRRREWDAAVSEVLKIFPGPPPRICARFAGGAVFNVEYKLYDRPHKTSLVMTPADARTGAGWLTGGGGSWRYEAGPGSTEWVQTNTLVLRDHWLLRWLRPVISAALRWSTRRAMSRAKRRIESAT